MLSHLYKANLLRDLSQMKRVMQFLLFTAVVLFLIFIWSDQDVEIYQLNPVERIYHDKNLFTQGLEYKNGLLYEGSGLRGASELRVTKIGSDEILQRRFLEKKYFGEGITIFEDQIYQLTWQSGKGFIYDLNTLELRGEFSINGEGWGLTNDGKRLIMSNGSDKLIFLNPYSLKPTGELSVTLEGKPQFLLNELEYINGEVWANIWKNDQIVIIDPLSGKVKSIVDLSNFSERKTRHDVSNGIAFDKEQNTVYLTGKNWSFIYVSRLDEKRKINRNLFSRAYSRFGFLLR